MRITGDAVVGIGSQYSSGTGIADAIVNTKYFFFFSCVCCTAVRVGVTTFLLVSAALAEAQLKIVPAATASASTACRRARLLIAFIAVV